MTNEEKIVQILSSIDKKQEAMVNLMDQLLKLFSKYDDQYLTEVESDGLKIQ
jgi:hypothetical protein